MSLQDIEDDKSIKKEKPKETRSKEIQNQYIQNIPSFERDDDLTIVTTAESSQEGRDTTNAHNHANNRSNQDTSSVRNSGVLDGPDNIDIDLSTLSIQNQLPPTQIQNLAPKSSLAAAVSRLETFDLMSKQNPTTTFNKPSSMTSPFSTKFLNEKKVAPPPPGFISPISVKSESRSMQYLEGSKSAPSFKKAHYRRDNRICTRKDSNYSKNDPIRNVRSSSNRGVRWGSSYQDNIDSFNDNSSHGVPTSLSSSFSQSTSSNQIQKEVWKNFRQSQQQRNNSNVKEEVRDKNMVGGLPSLPPQNFRDRVQSMPLMNKRSHLKPTAQDNGDIGSDGSYRGVPSLTISSFSQSTVSDNTYASAWKNIQTSREAIGLYDNDVDNSMSLTDDTVMIPPMEFYDKATSKQSRDQSLMSSSLFPQQQSDTTSSEAIQNDFPSLLLPLPGSYAVELANSSSSSHSSYSTDNFDGRLSDSLQIWDDHRDKKESRHSFGISGISSIKESNEPKILPEMIQHFSSSGSGEGLRLSLEQDMKNTSSGSQSTKRSIDRSRKREWCLKMNKRLAEIPVGKLDPEEVPISALMNVSSFFFYSRNCNGFKCVSHS